ncbi:uncharacterized protein MKK02DRAFT_38737 [Dioszegia hungarica]|uniref:Uncharacterized protein n=1 Tax=Dioszegia hungarica TaxID=4972 RepID=A0AA38LUM9_9TREE|nr:uncharacterized protein MKK02DRAFT_38737 [Dioszegia hungarica]KAI9634066.1 hypothetical protein MKK02DRAFT_38737 [Dioszegia hungarica]
MSGPMCGGGLHATTALGTASKVFLSNQPKSLPHTFTLPPLRQHFNKTPNPAASNKLIDLPGTEFLGTEEEITVIAAALMWRVRKWIIKRRGEVVGRLAGKIEPPFTAYSIDQMLKDVGAMMEELLVKTLVQETVVVGKT